ncbi:MAG: manganese catalase family protein [Oscillospiraceae bacterium]
MRSASKIQSALAKFICSQYGGPDGELGASLRYLNQRYAMPYPELSAILTDIGTEAAEVAGRANLLPNRTKI